MPDDATRSRVPDACGDPECEALCEPSGDGYSRCAAHATRSHVQMRCPACGRSVDVNPAGNAVRHMRPERELAWRVCTPSARITQDAERG